MENRTTKETLVAAAYKRESGEFEALKPWLEKISTKKLENRPKTGFRNRRGFKPEISHRRYESEIASMGNSEVSSESSIVSIRRKDVKADKPVLMLIIENFFKEVALEVESGRGIEWKLHVQVPLMTRALNDLIVVMPDLSIYFYNTVKNILDLLENRKSLDYEKLAVKFEEYAGFIEEEKFRSDEHPVSKYDLYIEQVEEPSLEEIREILKKNLQMMNLKSFKLLKKVSLELWEMKETVKAFLMLVNVINRNFGIKTSKKIENLDRILLAFIDPPGEAVETLRKIFIYLENERLPLKLAREIHLILKAIDFEHLRNEEKTGLGYALYEFTLNSLKFYDKYAERHYGKYILVDEYSLLTTSVNMPNERLEALNRLENLSVEIRGPKSSYSSSPFRKFETTDTFESPVKVVPRKRKVKEENFKFKDKSKENMLVNILAEQNIDEEFEMFLRDKLIMIQHDLIESGSANCRTVEKLSLDQCVRLKENFLDDFGTLKNLSSELMEKLTISRNFYKNLEAAVFLIEDPDYRTPSNSLEEYYSQFSKFTERC